MEEIFPLANKLLYQLIEVGGTNDGDNDVIATVALPSMMLSDVMPLMDKLLMVIKKSSNGSDKVSLTYMYLAPHMPVDCHAGHQQGCHKVVT